MAELYTFDKPMQVTDYHSAIMASVNTKAAFLAMLRDGPEPKNWEDSWAVKKFPTTKNPKSVEGRDKTSGWTSSVPHELKGMCQTMDSDGYMVTRHAKKRTAGYESADPVSDQQAIDAENFTLSIEKVLLSTQEAAYSAATKERLTRGAASWLSASAHSYQDIPAELRPTADQHVTTAFNSFNEDALVAMLQACALQKKSKVSLMGYVGLKLKQKMSGFNYKLDITSTLGAARTVDSDPEKVQMMVDVFEYDAGILRTMWMPNLMCDMASDTLADTFATNYGGIFIDPSMWQVGWWERITHKQNADEGAGPRGYHYATARLECLNPMGQCLYVPTALA